MPAIPAIVTFSIFLISFTLMIGLTHTFGFTRILGMGHFLWIPLVIYLVTQVDFAQLSNFYNLWLTSIIVCNSISLVIDITDVYRYVQGDKAEIVDFATPHAKMH